MRLYARSGVVAEAEGRVTIRPPVWCAVVGIAPRPYTPHQQASRLPALYPPSNRLASHDSGARVLKTAHQSRVKLCEVDERKVGTYTEAKFRPAWNFDFRAFTEGHAVHFGVALTSYGIVKLLSRLSSGNCFRFLFLLWLARMALLLCGDPCIEAVGIADLVLEHNNQIAVADATKPAHVVAFIGVQIEH